MATPPEPAGAEIHARTLKMVERIARQTGASADLVAAIGLALSPLSRSAWPDVAWRFSRLTAGGHPLEFGVSTHEDRLRVTLEVAGPERPDAERLDAALDFLARLGLPAPEAARVDALKALQASAPLRWGCWLGLRQRVAGFTAKLYVEAPRAGDAEPWSRLVAGASLRMVGYEVASQRDEAYFALPAVAPREAVLRLAAMGVADPPGMLAVLADATGVSLVELLRCAPLGVSVSDPGGEVALFVDSGRLAGAAEAIRRRMNGAAGGLYRTVFDRPGPAPAHGVVTVTARGGGYELRAGMAGNAIA